MTETPGGVVSMADAIRVVEMLRTCNPFLSKVDQTIMDEAVKLAKVILLGASVDLVEASIARAEAALDRVAK